MPELSHANANQIAAALRVFQAVRQTQDGAFREYNGQRVTISEMEHFEDTPEYDDDAIESLIDKVYEMHAPEEDENACRDCGEHYDDGGDGYDGLCPSCADKAESEVAQ